MIYTASLLPGDLEQRGGAYKFSDAAAKRGLGIRGGLARVELRPLPKVEGGMRVTIWAYANLTSATVAEMTVEITVGGDTTTTTAIWIQRSYGWQHLHR
jgi:hypothetical protein